MIDSDFSQTAAQITDLLAANGCTDQEITKWQLLNNSLTQEYHRKTSHTNNQKEPHGNEILLRHRAKKWIRGMRCLKILHPNRTNLPRLISNLTHTVEYLSRVVGDDAPASKSDSIKAACQWVAKLHPRNMVPLEELMGEHYEDDVLEVHSWAYGLAAFMGNRKFLDKLDEKNLLGKLMPDDLGYIIGAAAQPEDLSILPTVTKNIMTQIDSGLVSSVIPFAAAIASSQEPNIAEFSPNMDLVDRVQIVHAAVSVDSAKLIRTLVRLWQIQDKYQGDKTACTTVTNTVKLIDELLHSTTCKDCYIYHCDSIMKSAIQHNRPNAVRALLELQADDLSKRYINGKHAAEHVRIAMEFDADRVFHLLVKFGLPLYHQDSVCLNYSTLSGENGGPHIVKLLLDKTKPKFDFQQEASVDTVRCNSYRSRTKGMRYPVLPVELQHRIIGFLVEGSSNQSIGRWRLINKMFAEELLRNLSYRTSFQIGLLKSYKCPTRFVAERSMSSMLWYNLVRPNHCQHGFLFRLERTVDYLLQALDDFSPESKVSRRDVTEKACEWAAKLHPPGILTMEKNPEKSCQRGELRRRPSHECSNTEDLTDKLPGWAYGLAAFMGKDEVLDALDKKAALNSNHSNQLGRIIGAAAHTKNPRILHRVTQTILPMFGSDNDFLGDALAAAITVGHESNMDYLFETTKERTLTYHGLKRIIAAAARVDKISIIERSLQLSRRFSMVLNDCVLVATVAGSRDSVIKLLESNGESISRVEFRDDAIKQAIRSYRPTIVRALLKYPDPGSYFSIQSGAVRSYALHACSIGADKVFRELIELGMGIDQKVHGEWLEDNFLSVASTNGWFHMVECLLSLGLNIHSHGLNWKSGKKYSKGTIALSKACLHGETSIVRLLLDAGMSVATSYHMPAVTITGSVSLIEIAMKRGHQDTVRLLLERGAQIPRHGHWGAFEWIRDDGRKVFPLTLPAQDAYVLRKECGYVLRAKGLELGITFDYRWKGWWKWEDLAVY